MVPSGFLSFYDIDEGTDEVSVPGVIDIIVMGQVLSLLGFRVEEGGSFHEDTVTDRAVSVPEQAGFHERYILCAAQGAGFRFFHTGSLP